MKLRQILKLKFLYLFNRNTKIILLLNIICLVFSFAIEIINKDIKDSYESIIENYVLNAYLYTKILMVFFNVYLYSYTISFKNDFLVYLLIPLGVKKEKSISISVALNIIVNLFIFIILFIAFSYLGLLLDDFYVKKEYILAFFSIMLISIIYGLYSMLLMQVISNFFVIIVIMSIFIITSNVNFYDLSLTEEVILVLLPNLNEKGTYIYSSITLILLLFILLIVNVIVYKNRDLNF